MRPQTEIVSIHVCHSHHTHTTIRPPSLTPSHIKAFIKSHIAKCLVWSVSHVGVSFLHHHAAIPSHVVSSASGFLEDANSIAKGASQDVNSTRAQQKPPLVGNTV